MVERAIGVAQFQPPAGAVALGRPQKAGAVGQPVGQRAPARHEPVLRIEVEPGRDRFRVSSGWRLAGGGIDGQHRLAASAARFSSTRLSLPPFCQTTRAT